MSGVSVDGRMRPVAAGAGLSLVPALLLAAPAQGATFVVDDLGDTTPDGGPGYGCAAAGGDECTLREAVLAGNESGGGDEVLFASGLSGTLQLQDGSIFAEGPAGGDLAIRGPGAKALTVTAAPNSRHFDIYSTSDFELSGVTLSGGNPAGGVGGAIAMALPADVTITGAAITGNTASGAGGGILAQGGAGSKTLTVEDSTVSGNNGSSGGGIWASEMNVVLRNSTISGNTATATQGGGIKVYDAGAGGGGITATSSTISGNSAAGAGGGVYAYAGNPTRSLTNTIVADNSAPTNADFSAPSVSAAFSLIEAPGTTTVTAAVASSNVVGVDPQLGPLADNGGPTRTVRPLTGSAAIDKGMELSGPDQRGFARPVDVPFVSNSLALGANGADIGAVELTLAEATAPVTCGTCGNVTPPPPPPPKKCKKGQKLKKGKCVKKKRRKGK